MTLKITVSGPGGTFGLEMKYIQQVLEDLGWQVTTIDEHPLNEELEDASKKYRQQGNRSETGFGNNARLIADHQPWGG